MFVLENKFILFLVISFSTLVCFCHGQITCTEEKRAEAEKMHQKCIETVEARTDTGPGRLFSLCQMLDEQIHKCGEHLSECLTTRDLRLVKDAQISAFTKFMDAQKLSHLYQDCAVVREFRDSGRQPYKETDLCSITEVGEVLKTREMCVRNETMLMKNKMRTVNRFSDIEKTQVLCEFVDKSMHDCAKEIEKCYSSEEFLKFTQQSYLILSKVLEKFGSDFTLEQCQNLATPVPLRDMLSSSSTVPPRGMLSGSSQMTSLNLATPVSLKEMLSGSSQMTSLNLVLAASFILNTLMRRWL